MIRFSRTTALALVFALVVAASGTGTAGPGEPPTPVVSWLHTLSIHVRSHAIHDALHTLLAETLELPRTYEPVTYGQRKYIAVWAGNIALEPSGPHPAHYYLHTDFEAMFYGLTFAPFETAAASAAVLDARGIGHAEPTDTLRIEDETLRAPNVFVGIGGGVHDQGLRTARAAFERDRGGPLGLERVGEIVIGYSDEANLRSWTAFLEPHVRLGEAAFRVGEGPVLRFVKSDVKEVQGIVLEVRSLERAAAFLREADLLGRGVDGSSILRRDRTHGIRIALRE